MERICCQQTTVMLCKKHQKKFFRKKGKKFAQCYRLNCILLKIHSFPYFLSYLPSGCSGDYNYHLVIMQIMQNMQARREWSEIFVICNIFNVTRISCVGLLQPHPWAPIFLLNPSLIPQQSIHHLKNLVISRIFYKWNQTVCHLLRLTFYST